MDEAKSYYRAYDVGGPMDLGAEYRWNVPVLTYGFDSSFQEYFGSNGVAAVESAIAMLNGLPTASLMSLPDFSLYPGRVNVRAEQESLIDLKSTTLALLLEQLGLASAERYAFCLRSLTNDGTQVLWSVIQRNFDPFIPQPTNMLNEVELGYWVTYSSARPPLWGAVNIVAVDPQGPWPATVAGAEQLQYGEYFPGLTRDDAGGLRYLLSAANTNVEALLPDVHGAGTNAGNFVNIALRPGVEKITFLPHSRNPGTGTFLSMTNQFVDTYISGGMTNQQMLERVTLQPDILFAASDMGGAGYERTRATNWVNHSVLNGSPGGAGPGVIRPPVVLNLDRVGTSFIAYQDPTNVSVDYYSFHWASFDGSTNSPIVYPDHALPGPGTVRILLYIWHPPPAPDPFTVGDFHWNLPDPLGASYAVKASTNLTEWVTVTNFVNTGNNFIYTYQANDDEIPRFFRFVPLP